MSETRTRFMERRGLRAAGVALIAGVALSGCMSRSGSDADGTQPPTSKTSEQQGGLRTISDIDFTHGWDLPAPISLKPRIMTEADCMNTFWLNEEGKRAPLVQQDPSVIATTDGRCNTPLNSEVNGIYSQPAQIGDAIPTYNGDPLGVECWIGGESIQDVRGPSVASKVWFAVETADRAHGFFPKVNLGFLDEGLVRPC